MKTVVNVQFYVCLRPISCMGVVALKSAAERNHRILGAEKVVYLQDSWPLCGQKRVWLHRSRTTAAKIDVT